VTGSSTQMDAQKTPQYGHLADVSGLKEAFEHA
jgi:hypothetical protein